MSSARFPFRYGKYILLDRLNKGGMAEVFRAKTIGSVERLVAIKCMLEALADDEEFTTMFVDEAKLAAQLSHANIVQIFELGRMEDQLYIAMELVHGRDLRAVIKQANRSGQKLPLPFAAYVLSRAADGLDYAHRKHSPDGKPLNIVHRDVSPQNILVGYDGEVKVADFGIAKAERRATETRAGMLKGKFAYMAPEQVMSSKLDGRTDVFALGSVLFEAVAGKKLFSGDSDYSILERVNQVDLPTDGAAWERFTPELRAIVEKATKRAVDERYQQAADLSEALQPFLIENRTIFGAKQAAELMSSLFADDIATHAELMQRYAKVTVDQCVSRAPEEDSEPRRKKRPAGTASRHDFSIVAREPDGVPSRTVHEGGKTVDLGPRSVPAADAATQLLPSMAELIKPTPMGRTPSKSASGSNRAPIHELGPEGSRTVKDPPYDYKPEGEPSVTRNPTVRRVTLKPLLTDPRYRLAVLGLSGAVALTLIGVLIVVATRPVEGEVALPPDVLAQVSAPLPGPAPPPVPPPSPPVVPMVVAKAEPPPSPPPRPVVDEVEDEEDDPRDPDKRKRASAVGYIAVTSDSGRPLRVWIDGKDVGAAPLTVKVKLGKRKVRMAEEDGRAKMLEVTVKKNHSRKEPFVVKGP